MAFSFILLLGSLPQVASEIPRLFIVAIGQRQREMWLYVNEPSKLAGTEETAMKHGRSGSDGLDPQDQVGPGFAQDSDNGC